MASAGPPDIRRSLSRLPGLAACLLGAACVTLRSERTTPGDASASVAEELGRLDAAQLVDLSHPFDERTIYWPTADGFRLRRDAAGVTPGGYWYASNSICASEHGGTHIDAPFHFSESGWTADRIPLTALIARACVIDVRGACAGDRDHELTPSEIEAFEARHGPIPGGAVVLVRTGWEARWPDRKAYLGDDTPGRTTDLHFPGLSAEAARLLAGRRVTGVGIDTASIDPGPSRDFAAHRILAAANAYNLENLAGLDRLPPVGATLVTLPMKIAGGSGGPARVVAILP